MEEKQRKSLKEWLLDDSEKALFQPNGFCWCFDSIEERKATVGRRSVSVAKTRRGSKSGVGCPEKAEEVNSGQRVIQR
jgi:hypothetical protein